MPSRKAGSSTRTTHCAVQLSLKIAAVARYSADPIGNQPARSTICSRTLGRWDAGTLGRRVEARTCTAAAAARTQVQMQPSQHGPKSAIRHDMSPCLQCTLRNRKYCVLQVRLSGAEPVHRGRGQLCIPRCGVKSLRPAMQASMAVEEVFPRNLKSGCASFCGTVLLAVIQIRQCVTDSIP